LPPAQPSWTATYKPADLLKDARDVVADPAAFESMIVQALHETLESHYAITRRWWPKQKRLLRDLNSWDAVSATMTRAVLDTAASPDARLDALGQLVDRVLEPVGGVLKEWESEREPVNADGTLGTLPRGVDGGTGRAG
jgi:hypothetical protein